MDTDRSAGEHPVTLFLSGDVMTGRGIDQILPHPGDPFIDEPWMTSAQDYVDLAEAASGPIPRRVSPDYIWGDGLAVLDRVGPDLRIINLETAVTTHDRHWPRKGIQYRMHPANIDCIKAAGIDCCVLANNHVMDWRREGLEETLRVLDGAGLTHVGAGLDREQACAPVFFPLPGGGRLLIFALGSPTSGVPPEWSATEDRSGVCFLNDLSQRLAEQVSAAIRAYRQPGDRVLISLHWGGNWGYWVPDEQRAFARALIEAGAVDGVHAHSSHHPRGIEVYRDRPILYGCGDLLNDYEGIQGYERYRDDLSLMYFLTLDANTGQLLRLRMAPMQIRQFRLNRASDEDARWLRDTLDEEGGRFGTGMSLDGEGMLCLDW